MVLFFALVIGVGMNDVESQASVENRFRSQCPQAWSALANCNQAVRGSVKRHFVRDLPKKKNDDRCTINFQFDAGRWRVDMVGATTGKRVALCRNNDEIFMVEADSSTAQPVLRSLERSTATNLAVEEIDSLAWDSLTEFLESPWAISVASLESLLFGSSSKIVSIKAENDGLQELVRIQFGATIEAKNPIRIEDSSWVLLWPANNWSIRKYELRFANVRSTGNVEYGPLNSEACAPLRSLTIRQEAPIGFVQTTYEMERCEFSKSSDDDFKLSAFGLGQVRAQPEVNSDGRRTLILVAVALLVVAFSIRIWAQRRMKEA